MPSVCKCPFASETRLQAVGSAPLYGQHRWQDPAMASVRDSWPCQVLATSASALAQLHDELKPMPGDTDGLTTSALLADDLAVPIRLRTPAGTLSFITMLSVFGAPRDVTLSEIAVEALLPADAATGAASQALMGSRS